MAPGISKSGDLLAEVYERYLSFRSVKRPESLTDAFFGCEKVEKTFFVTYSYLKDI